MARPVGDAKAFGDGHEIGARTAGVPRGGHTADPVGRPGMRPHRHGSCYEICLLDRGTVDLLVDRRVVTIDSGQVYLTRPGEMHGSITGTVQPRDLWWFQLEESGAWATTAAERRLHAEIATWPRVINGSIETRATIRAFVSEQLGTAPHGDVIASSALAMALALLSRDASAEPPPLTPGVAAARAMIEASPQEPMSVAEIAASVGWSPTGLQARFSAELSCSIAEYQTRVRLRAAKQLLIDSDRSITDIAHGLAFSSSQYFATFFANRTGLSPTDYRDVVRQHDPVLTR